MSDYDEYDYQGYQYEQEEPMEEENDEEIEIENIFNQAEDELKSNPLQSFEDFKQVIEKESSLSAENKKKSFQSYKVHIFIQQNLIILSIRLKKEYQNLIELIEKLLDLMIHQYKNEGNEALKQVVEMLINSDDVECSDALNKLLTKLKQLNQYHLYSNANLKLCKNCINKREYQKLIEIFEVNLDNLLSSDIIADQERKKTIQIELSAYKIQYYQDTNQTNLIKPLYRKLQKINFNIYEPNIVGLINLTIGQFQALERQYEASRNYLVNAFYSFQDGGNHQSAIQSLKYASIISILENFRMNLFDDMRSKPYDGDEEVQKFKKIRNSYETQNIEVFGALINEEFFNKDKFLNKIKPNLQLIIVECKLIKLSKCYSRITLDYLSKILLLNHQELIKLIQGMITRKTITATINEVAQYVEVRELINNEQTQALKTMIDQVVALES